MVPDSRESRHRIRLGNAWEPPSPSHPVWRRRFGRPSGVVAGDRVLLVLDRRPGPTAGLQLRLNGAALPPLLPGPGRWEHDVTLLLAARNELVVEPLAPPPAGEADGRAALPEAYGRVSIEIVSG